MAAPLQNCSDFLKFYFKIHFKRACQVLLFSLDVVVLVELFLAKNHLHRRGIISRNLSSLESAALEDLADKKQAHTHKHSIALEERLITLKAGTFLE